MYEVSRKALDQYRQTVKGNEKTSKSQVVLKLSRNIQLVKEEAPDRIEKKLLTTTYKYGNLHIATRFGRIVSVINHAGKPVDWTFPQKRYIQLNREYGIKDCKFTSSKRNRR